MSATQSPSRPMGLQKGRLMSFDAALLSHHGAGPGIHTVYLALGSNVGDRHENLIAALHELHKFIAIQRVSSVYETAPIGYAHQSDFLNIACSGQTWLLPQKLLHTAKKIEMQLGRTVSFRNGPRLIDIDILIYDALQLSEENLTIPHPRMAERTFVLAPLAEIAPEVIDPNSGKTIEKLLHALPYKGITKLAASLPFFSEQ